MTDLGNELRFAQQHRAVLERENDRLKGRVAYLETVGQFGTANAPTLTPSPFWPDERLRLVR